MEDKIKFKQDCEQEYTKIAVELHNLNDRKDVLVNRMKELVVILTTLNRFNETEKPE